ncbi:MAG: amidohydrolase family protein, partial [Nitrososphaeria archaeon]|nr:amidohydrolase family protein [Nitrososphaeria archaeon]
MNEGRVDKAVIFGAGPYLFPQFNKMIAETVNKYPDRLIGFARVDPYEGEKAVDELAHAVKDLGMKGLKLHPLFQGFRIDSPVVHTVLEEVRKMDIPVL